MEATIDKCLGTDRCTFFGKSLSENSVGVAIAVTFPSCEPASVCKGCNGCVSLLAFSAGAELYFLGYGITRWIIYLRIVFLS